WLRRDVPGPRARRRRGLRLRLPSRPSRRAGRERAARAHERLDRRVVTASRPWACALIACVGAGLLPAIASPSSTRRPALRVRVYHFVDRSRTIALPDGRHVPRPVETVVRYPAAGGPYPLVVFGHGYALTPAPYTPL